MFHTQKFQEFLRFCVVGVVATMIHYGLYLLLIQTLPVDNSWWTNVAYSVGYFTGFLCNLWLSAHFTFKEKITVKIGVGFTISNAVNYSLHLLFLNFFLWIGLQEQWAPIPVYCIVVPINFLLVRFVFKKMK